MRRQTARTFWAYLSMLVASSLGLAVVSAFVPRSTAYESASGLLSAVDPVPIEHPFSPHPADPAPSEDRQAVAQAAFKRVQVGQWLDAAVLRIAQEKAAAEEAARVAAEAKARAQVHISAPPAANYAAGSGGAWACIRQHESGGNYADNTGNTFYGAYQFDIGTWNAQNTGYARADLAPPAVQDAAAANLQRQRGFAPWPLTSRMCGLR